VSSAPSIEIPVAVVVGGRLPFADRSHRDQEGVMDRDEFEVWF
jgi:hypothetical protein